MPSLEVQAGSIHHHILRFLRIPDFLAQLNLDKFFTALQCIYLCSASHIPLKSNQLFMLDSEGHGLVPWIKQLKNTVIMVPNFKIRPPPPRIDLSAERRNPWVHLCVAQKTKEKVMKDVFGSEIICDICCHQCSQFPSVHYWNVLIRKTGYLELAILRMFQEYF